MPKIVFQGYSFRPPGTTWSAILDLDTGVVQKNGGIYAADHNGFMNSAVVHRVKIESVKATSNTDLKIYADRSKTVLLYVAMNLSTYPNSYDDIIPWHYRDQDLSKTLHFEVQNNGSVTTAYKLTIQAIGG